MANTFNHIFWKTRFILSNIKKVFFLYLKNVVVLLFYEENCSLRRKLGGSRPVHKEISKILL